MIADALISMRLLAEDRLPALRAKWLDKLNTSHDSRLTLSRSQHTRANAALTYLHDMDPTPNKQYLNRLVDWYHKGQIRVEDGHRVRNALKAFHGTKTRITAEHAGPEVKNPKDIHTYPSIHHLERALEAGGPTVATPWTKTTAAQRQAVLDGSTVLHDDPNLTVRQVHDHHAMKVLGSGTHWCVVPDRDTFRDYSDEGPLFHIHDKKTGRRHLLHFESEQLMNEEDEPVHPDVLSERHPVLKQLFHGKSYTMFSDPKQVDQEIIAGHHHNSRLAWEAAEKTSNPHVLHALRHSQFAGGHDRDYEPSDDPDYDGTTVSELVAGNPSTESHTLDDIARSPRGRNSWSRIARHQNTSPETLDHIARHGDGAEYAVAMNKNARPDTLEHLSEKPMSDFSRRETDAQLAFHKRTPRHVLEKMIDKHGGDYDIGVTLANRDDLSPRHLHKLLDRSSWPHVHVAMARNRNANADLLHRIWTVSRDSPDADRGFGMDTAEAVASHENTRPDTLEDIARRHGRKKSTTPNIKVLRAVALNKNSTTRALEYTRRLPGPVQHHTWGPTSVHRNALPAWRDMKPESVK